MAIATQTLIQPNEVVNSGLLRAAPINNRFDAQLLTPHIAAAEESFVVPVLTRDFYEWLIEQKAGRVSNYNTSIAAQVKAFDGAGLEKAEELWKVHLLPYCAWAVYFEALPFIAFQTGSNGVFLAQTEHANNVGASGVKFLQDTTRRRIDQMKERMLVWLCENKAEFTEFDGTSICPEESGCDGSTETKNTLENRFGIYYTTK